MAIQSDSGRAAAKIWLTRKEKQLRDQLNHGDMPVLGLYVDHFSPDMRAYFRRSVLDPADPVGSYVRGLELWPATFATFLTVHIVEGYGESGTGEVYTYVQDALGLNGRSLGAGEREKLAAAYRRSCVALGLSVVPLGESRRPLVDEYLRQVGVPVPYFRGLFEGFAHQARRVGVPDPDDPADVRSWELFVDIPQSRPVLRRAVENDEQGYYARLYLQVSELESESACLTVIEKAAFAALRDIGESVQKRRALIPSLNWRDEELGVLLPPGDERRWTIKVEDAGGQSLILPPIQGDRDPRFVPLPTPLPLRCRVVSGDLEFGFSIWESAADNQVVLFDRGGRLVGRGRLGGDRIPLDPGTYALISRWKPHELGEAPLPVSNDVALFSSPLDLAAGQTISFTRGPATLEVVARSVPSLSWQGQRLVGMTGRELYWGQDLAVRVSIPEEVLERAEQGFELVLTRRGLSDHVIPLERDVSGSVDIRIGQLLEEMEIGVDKVVVKLRRSDIPNRPLTSISGFVWPGLRSATIGRFTCASSCSFKNLDFQESDNLSVEGASLTYSDADQRFFRTVFKIASGEVAAFQWPVPGVFLALEETREGQPVERPIAKRDVIQVRPSSRQRLKVYSDANGVLKLGAYTRELRSGLLGGTHIYLANLAEFLSPEHHTLILNLPSVQHEEPLVELVTPHQLLKFDSRRSSDNYSLDFEFIGELGAMSVRAVDVLTGVEEVIHVGADSTGISRNPFEKVALVTKTCGRSTLATLTFLVNDWSDGLWVLHLEAKLKGRWGKLVNARGDVFAGGMRIPQGLTAAATLPDAEPQREFEIFERLVGALLECYSIESWRDLEWLANEWDCVAGAITSHLPTLAHELLDLALKKVPETSAESWVPVKSIAARMIELFGLPYLSYRGFSGGLGTTRAIIGSGKLTSGRDDKLFSEEFFSIHLMMGFRNGKQVAQHEGERLKEFSLENFSKLATFVDASERRRILASMDWAPAPGQLLGVRHYWWAAKRMANRFHAAQVENNFRKGNALRLGSRVATIGAAGVHAALSQAHLSKVISLGLLDPRLGDEEESQDAENLEHVVDIIGLLAYAARMHARQQGLLLEVKDSLGAQVGLNREQLDAVLGFILYIGMDLFVFYLGLWEFVLARDYDQES